MRINGICTSEQIGIGNNPLTFVQMAEPSNPPEDQLYQWLSNGTGVGDQGDLMTKNSEGAVTKTATMQDFSILT